MSHMNTTFDPDIDSFLNLDQAEYTPATTSPNTQRPSLAQQSSSASTSHFATSSTPQTFAGPSFQYDAYRQQTGLPVGGLANTFAVNQNSGLQQWDGQGGFVMPDETINLPLSKVEDFDFNRPFDFNDMELEDDSPADLPTMFYPTSSSSQTQFVSPTTLVSSNQSPSTSTPVQRIYPGMHSQAAQAKAQQAQQKQQEMIRKQQQARQIPGQKPLPKTPVTKDPQVEESISRILNQMRQKSVSSVDEDSASMPSISNMPRIKKDEDDMDDDERLLASEEGKKLTSKERRQLRNKVSARAFRSRRKEYIGQLEGDLTAKADESAALRAENRQLREENTRLTDLTRMLLSSQSFAGFLQELSQGNVAEGSRQQSRQERPQQQAQPQPTRKDVNPHEAARQLHNQQPQIGMALIPEAPVDMSLYDTSSWNTSGRSTDYHVFSVNEVPRGPAVEITKLGGKTEQPAVLSAETLKMIPAITEVPEAVQNGRERPAIRARDVTVTDEKCSLMADRTKHSDASFVPVKSPKFALGLCTSESDVEAAVDGRTDSVEAGCSELEQTLKRLALMIPGLE